MRDYIWFHLVKGDIFLRLKTISFGFRWVLVWVLGLGSRPRPKKNQFGFGLRI